MSIKKTNKIQSSYIYERCLICKVLYVAQCHDPLHDFFYRMMILLNIFIQLLSNCINTGLYFHLKNLIYLVSHVEYGGGNIAKKKHIHLALGNSGRPRPVTETSKVNVLKCRTVTENHE